MSRAIAVDNASVAYSIAVEHATAAGIPVENVRPHTLRVYAALNPKTNNYEFNVAESSINVLPGTEIKLGTNDYFVASAIGTGIHSVIAKNVAGAFTYYPALTRILSYPDPTIFSAAAPAGAVGTEAQALMSLFNGKLTIQTNQEVVVEDFDMANFLFVPETQQSASTQPNLPGLVTRVLGKVLKFAGDKTNKLKLTINADSIEAIEGARPAAGATGRVNYAVMIVQGFIVKDGAKAVRVFN